MKVGKIQKCRICGCSDLSNCKNYCYWITDELCSKCFFTLSDEERKRELDYRYRKYRIGEKIGDRFPIYSPRGTIIAECFNIDFARKIVRSLNK